MRLLADPMRREILRLLAAKSLTGTELSRVLGLSPASVSHHLQTLERNGFIAMVKEEPGKHGILQKFFTSNAQVFLVDTVNLPTRMRRYFMPSEIERVRGMLASLKLSNRNIIDSSAGLLDKLCDDFCRFVLEVAREWAAPKREDPEGLIVNIYGEALRRLLKSHPELLHGLTAPGFEAQ